VLHSTHLLLRFDHPNSNWAESPPLRSFVFQNEAGAEKVIHFATSSGFPIFMYSFASLAASAAEALHQHSGACVGYRENGRLIKIKSK
jgi:hypothetical protein